MIDVPRPDPDTIARADRALVRTVDALSESQYAEPSQLPGWTRAHVVAHLALNGEGLAGVLHGAHVGRPAPMYASPEARA
ncbi:MAG TPA: maleylpyruvate isomerase N-terminal domain-containing protein, partial [Nocardioides sp.]|nr:maleylpyruvate isomerase N-terminal domain-containing protein [Nocardioides sp.]